MFFKLLFEINHKQIQTLLAVHFLKVFIISLNLEQTQYSIREYYRLHIGGPKIAICETLSLW